MRGSTTLGTRNRDAVKVRPSKSSVRTHTFGARGTRSHHGDLHRLRDHGNKHDSSQKRWHGGDCRQHATPASKQPKSLMDQAFQQGGPAFAMDWYPAWSCTVRQGCNKKGALPGDGGEGQSETGNRGTRKSWKQIKDMLGAFDPAKSSHRGHGWPLHPQLASTWAMPGASRNERQPIAPLTHQAPPGKCHSRLGAGSGRFMTAPPAARPLSAV